jgi:diguanylate cyclase (GGDEF)-like protein
MAEAAAARELNNSMTGVLLAYVRRVGGEAAVTDVLERAGDATPLDELEDPSNWSSYAETLARFTAAASVLGDPEVGLHAGEELFGHYASSEIIALLRSLGSTGAALQVIADTATKQSTVVTMDCVELADETAFVSAVTMVPTGRDKLFCDYTAGVLSTIPVIFGLERATVTEVECQRRGDGRCLYRLDWDARSPSEVTEQLAFLRAQVASLTGRFEALEQLASELAAIGDVDEALRRITERAGVAVWAPRFLLVAQLPSDRRPRVHAVGFDHAEAERCAAEVLSERPDDHDGARLIVDVVSSSHVFGRLAAFYPEGHRFLPEERRLLQAYAGHAAAVLDTAAALADARARATTLGALFDMSTVLSQVGTLDEMADRLARALPPVVGCDGASVFVFEPRDAVLECRGRCEAGTAERSERRRGELPHAIRLDSTLLAELCRHGEPRSFGPGAARSSLPVWAEIGSRAGYSAGVLMPLVARGELLGLVVAGSDRWSLDEAAGGVAGLLGDELHERLLGVAGIATTALDNARLLDQVRHQAGHDSLTGLPNARLLDELAEAAIATARRHGYSVGVLFVDLDLFKSINDELGHHAGDMLLVEVGARLRTAVRAGDTVARLGGDEFGVLLPHVTSLADAEAVAERVLAVFAAPVAAPGGARHVSASVGIAMSRGPGDDFESLLRRADVAMYDAKARGRGCYVADR